MIVPFSRAFFLDSYILATSQALIKYIINQFYLKSFSKIQKISQRNNWYFLLGSNNKFLVVNLVNILLNLTIQIQNKKMNINNMQFISHRDSIASQFAQQTANSSSMLSSRRRAFDDSQQNDLQDFKQQIQSKFMRSVANKIYTYPLNEEGLDLFDDEQEFAQLIGITQYNLFEQDQNTFGDGFKKQQFKIKNQKITSKTANLLLQTLKTQRQRISQLRNYISQALQTKKGSKNTGIFYTDAGNQNYKQHSQQQLQNDQNYRKKRLNTEPYQKPMGFIIKKK